MNYFKFLEEVKESQRDPDHFKWAFSARNINQPKGFYFSISDRVKQTPKLIAHITNKDKIAPGWVLLEEV